MESCGGPTQKQRIESTWERGSGRSLWTHLLGSPRVWEVVHLALASWPLMRSAMVMIFVLRFDIYLVE